MQQDQSNVIVRRNSMLITFFDEIVRGYTVSRIHQLPPWWVIQYNSMAIPGVKHRNDLKLKQDGRYDQKNEVA